MAYEIAAHAGFCMGVRRAVEAALRVAEEGKPSCTLGELIHNPEVVEMLRARGVPPIASAEQASGRQVLIRSHGVAPQVLEALHRCGAQVLDLTCPFVDKLHRIVEAESGPECPVILLGEKEHPEVQGTAGWARGPVYVLSQEDELDTLPPMDQALVVAQTTFPPARWEAMTQRLAARIPGAKLRYTICSATQTRQREAEELARRADAMIVVGGRHSANTRKLYDTCKRLCERTILVERAAEIPPGFANIYSEFIGITAGASTPDGSLKEVVTRMIDKEQQVLTNQEDAQKSFMAEVDATLVRIRPGQTVTGTVVQVTDDEVCVNIGYKSDGIIKRTELTQQDVKLGDELEVEVVKVNDGEGNVILSQRNIINKKAWDALMAKYEAGEYVEGVGKEAVKGGLICMVDGVRAFVPASRLSKRYVEKIDQFVGQTMKLKIIDVDAAKKRIVCSRKDVILEEEAAKKAAAWEKIEEGAILHGIVRRFADFGAFVDLGGVDGLIHITDLAWHRVGHPSEVLSINQEVEVKVLSVDRERERIQLGYKQLQAKPWDNIEEKYPVGLILERKVVRIRPFGAFVELEPGVDGLVHISQVALTRVNKVEDVLSVGQDVTVKVLGVDPAAHRISLSIREALEDKAFDYGEGIPEEEYPVDEQPAETQE